ncbi:MAG: hypothetical protein M1827_003294 [Pycnora praestabilis]|nr:MAG: hypothetical protein M1827_003294 [Pycnora praestabilis]
MATTQGTVSTRKGAAKHARDAAKDQDGSEESQDSSSTKIAHTLTACCRCRRRKTRCDAGLPKCVHCERAGSLCEYWDTSKAKKISRQYVIHLQDKVHELEVKLAQIQMEENAGPDTEAMVRGAGLVRFNETDESRFLGPSSGIAITRLVMELAKQNTATKSIREIVPDNSAREIKERFAKEDTPTSKVYPLISSVAAPDLPSRGLTAKLTESFNQRAQYLLPTLHEPTFRADTDDVYAGSKDPYQNFILRMVLAISMQKLEARTWAGLADSYYLAALSHLDAAVKPMDLKTLQCFVLIAQYSLLTPTRTAVYYIVGLAVKLCQQLGLTEERTVALSSSKYDLNALEQDMRRRLFWIVTSMEFGLAHSLGRPSAFAISEDHIDVNFFADADDESITASGVLAGPPAPKKRIAIHFFRMRMLQAEIRRKLYQKKRQEPEDDTHPWFKTMEAKLFHWRSSCPYNDEGSGVSAEWFTTKLHTIEVFLYRPSPQIPSPSVRAAEKCYDASARNLRLQRKQIDVGLIDITWIFTQSIFMAVNTILWTLSYAEIRDKYSRKEVEALLDLGLEAIYLCSERWPGASSAFELYGKLVKGCLRAYRGSISTDSEVPYNFSNKTSPESMQDVPIQTPIVSPSNTTESSRKSYLPEFGGAQYSSDYPFAYEQLPFPSDVPFLDQVAQNGSSPNFSDLKTFDASQQLNYSNYSQAPHFTEPAYNMPASTFSNQFSWDSYTDPLGMSGNPLSSPAMTSDPNLLVGPIGNEYNQSIYPPGLMMPQQHRHDSLSQAQQSQLMSSLETDGLADLSNVLEQSADFFSSGDLV